MIELHADNFREEVLDKKGTVLVDFWSPSCEPCKALLPHIEAMEKDHPAVVFGKVDLSKSRRLAISQKVSRVPAILLFVDGERQEMLSGEEATAQAIQDLLHRFQ